MGNFKYKLKENPLQKKDSSFLKYYLESLDIKKVDSFINKPEKQDEESPNNLDNIDALCTELYKGFEEGKKFFLQVDSDADGVTSSAIFYAFFKEIYPEAQIEYRVHEGKQHGVIPDTVPITADYVIIPDAGSNQFDEQRELAQQGRKVLIMDHHHVDNIQTMENVIVVNNQTSKDFRNKYLSGAGVVYKVIQHFSKKYLSNNLYETFTDLAAVGIISDMMDTRELDNNFIIYYGLKNINNPLLKAILNKQSYSVSSVDSPSKIDIAFYVAPLINAVIRMGTVEENTILFEGFIDYHNSESFQRKVRGGGFTSETYYEKIARESANVRARQNNVKMKAMEFLDQRIREQGMNDHSILVVETSRNDKIQVPKTMTGLVAMELVKKYKKPVLVLRPKKINGKEFLFGSGRASKAEGFESFRNELNETDAIDFAQGHDMAFGAGVERDKLPLLLEQMEEQVGEIDFGSDVIDVDYIFYGTDINEQMLREFATVLDIYGNGIAQPKFAFEFKLSADKVKVMGKKENTLKINVGSVEFIKFNCKDLADSIKENKDKILDIRLVGRSQINEFMGRKTTQIIIDHIDIKFEEMEMMF